MNEYQEYTPDERALKAEIEKLAGQIHADSDFVTGLEQTLMQHEAMQSADVLEFPRRRWSTPFLTLAAAIAVFLCAGIIVLSGILSENFADHEACGEDCSLATPLVATNFARETSITGSQTAIAKEGTQLAGTQVAAAATITPAVGVENEATQQAFASPTARPTLEMASQTMDGAHQGMLDTQEALATATTTSMPTGTLQPSSTPPGTATPAGTMVVFQPTMGASMAAGVIAPTIQPPISIMGATTTPGPGQFQLPQTLPPPTQMAMHPSATPLPQTGGGITESTLYPTPRPTATPLPNIPPQEMPPDMFFENYGVNPYLDTEDDQFSTFAMDVDSGSYTLARNYLMDVGTLPPAESIRPEEFINYFDMNYEPPEGEDAFAIHLDAAPAPFGFEDHYLMRVGLQGRYVAPEDRDPALLIFVIDVSGSMADGGRLELVKRAIALLLDELRPEDRVGIVVYTDTAWPVLEPIEVTERETILNAVNSLYPMNSTNVQDGLFQGYQMAERYRLRGEITRVILLSDGVANQGIVDPQSILDTVSRYAENDITLTTIGVGMGNYNDTMMEQLANDGDGSYHYVDTLREAERVFVFGLTSTLQVIAYDAKVQVEFNPEIVDRYRLIGYENRAIADEDFRDDTVDAGEVGAGAEPDSDQIGHNVTALYEMALENPDLPRDAVIATVYVRYQDAETREIVELQRQIAMADLLHDFNEAPPNMRLAAAAAEFAELLRESYWAQDGSYVDLLEFAEPLETAFPEEDDVLEFLSLIRIAGRYIDQ